MKNLLLAVLISVPLLNAMVLSQANAQSMSKAQIERIEDRLQKIRDRLNLTSAQKTAVKPIIISGLKERAFILKSAGIKRGTKPTLVQLLKVRNPIKKSRSKTEGSLSRILNPRQMTEYRLIMEEARKKMRARFN